MKSKWVAAFFLSGVSALLSAAPADRAVLAAMRLSEQPSYAWTSNVTDDARSYVVEGKTEVGRCTWMRLPMVNSIARRLGRQADVEIEAFFNASAAAVIRTERGWQTLHELPSRHWDRDDDIELWPVQPAPHVRAMQRTARAAPNIDTAGGFDPWETHDLPPVSLPRTAFPHADENDRPYSNAQFAASHPHDELAVIVSSFTHLRFDGEVITGTLTPIGAGLLLVRAGQDHLQPLAAVGAFKLIVKNGIVTRYYLRLEGILAVSRRQIRVRQNSTTHVTNIGATRLAVPDEARRKLGI